MKGISNVPKCVTSLFPNIEEPKTKNVTGLSLMEMQLKDLLKILKKLY
jgi:hypothetical protein